MSDNSAHESDQLNLRQQHTRIFNNTENGKCLAPFRPFAKHSCSYRWQAYRQALKQSHLYNGKGRELEGRFTVTVRKNAKKGEPRWERKRISAPKKGDWDVVDEAAGAPPPRNFRRSCNRPYWHEAHHLIPISELRGAIDAAVEGLPNEGRLRFVIRQGLLKEQYNINHMTNMVILPMDTTVARVVGLPTHLATPDRRNHSNYCDHVELELSKVFNPLQQSAQDHTKFEYRSAKKSLVDLSEQLRKKVVALGTKTQAGGAAASLDDI